jgi:hypothetical protein
VEILVLGILFHQTLKIIVQVVNSVQLETPLVIIIIVLVLHIVEMEVVMVLVEKIKIIVLVIVAIVCQELVVMDVIIDQALEYVM